MQFGPPQRNFRRADRNVIVGFQYVLRTVGTGRGVTWENDWMGAPHATAPEFRETRVMVSVGPFPSRNFEGRTVVMVRPVLH